MESDPSVSLRLTTTPGPGAWLMLDAAWPLAAAGVWRDGRWASFVRADGPAVESLFAITDGALRDAGVKLSELSGYIFAEGPGSVLGLRSAAMALRAWRVTPGVGEKPVLAGCSLRLAAALAAAERPAEGPFTVFAASRRDRWNVLAARSEHREECDTAGLASLPPPFLQLPARDVGAPPVAAEKFDPVAALHRHPEVFLTHGLLYLCDAPDAANLANTYATWAGDRHRG